MERHSKPLIRASIIVIMLFQVTALFTRQYLNRELAGTGLKENIAKDLSYLVVPIILLVIMWPILSENKVPLRRLLRGPKSWPKMILAATGLGIVLRLVWWCGVFALTSFGLAHTATPGNAIDISYYYSCPPLNALILTIIVMSVLTPLTEEVVNRGLILGTLSERDPRIAIFVTAILFAILHRPSGIPNAFVFGLFVGVQLIRYRTLWAPIITHATHNFLITLDWECLHVSWLPEKPTTSTILFGAGMTIIGLASAAVAIWLVAFIRPGAD